MEAGRELARELGRWADREDAVVLGLPRGGVPVAAEVARALRLPLDVFLVRKLGLPEQPELAMGAIGSGGIRVLNDEVVQGYGVAPEVIEKVARAEERELVRREQIYRAARPALPVGGKTAIVVDDGIATGSTMKAAAAALRQAGAATVVAAAPTIAQETIAVLRGAADEIVAVMAPDNFSGVGEWYEDFAQISDEEVRDCLAGRA